MPPILPVCQAFLQKIRPKTVLGNLYVRVTPWGIPVYGYVYWGPAYLHTWPVFVGGSLLFVGLSLLCITRATYLSSLSIRRYPEPQQAAQRVSLNLLLLLAFIVVGTRLTMWGFDAVHLFGYTYHPQKDRWVLGSVGLVYVLLAGIAEVVYAVSQWHCTQLEAQQLEKQRVQAQLDEVKQQVNPHFLFNSLNSLSVLIGEDPQQAERFVDEMATVYRYLLRAHRSSQLPALARLISLDAELRFIESYAYLLRTRYGAGLELHLAPPAAYPPGALLPLTLQLLVDNAIRHNVLSAARPLRIEIQPGAGYVRVQNTLQKRSVRVPMTRDGLASLQARYHLLGPAHTLQVVARDGQFSVLVPLVLA